MTIIHGASSLKRHLRQVNLPNHLKKLTYDLSSFGTSNGSFNPSGKVERWQRRR